MRFAFSYKAVTAFAPGEPAITIYFYHIATLPRLLPCELESIGFYERDAFRLQSARARPFSRFVAHRFIAIASDFYVSISKHARASSFSVNKPRRTVLSVTSTSRTRPREIARACVHRRTFTAANFIDSQACIEFVKIARFVSSG